MVFPSGNWISEDLIILAVSVLNSEEEVRAAAESVATLVSQIRRFSGRIASGQMELSEVVE